jgi:hypothetical protein
MYLVSIKIEKKVTKMSVFSTIYLFIRRFEKSEVFSVQHNYRKNKQKYFYTQKIIEMIESSFLSYIISD